MAFNFYEALTALSTAATGLLVLMQYRTQRALAAPHITCHTRRIENGELLVILRIRPADFAIRFYKITARKSQLAFEKSEYVQGNVIYSLDGAWRKSLPTVIDLAPSRYAPDSHTEQFFIKPRDSASSVLISLHTRVMWLPVRYNMKAEIAMSS